MKQKSTYERAVFVEVSMSYTGEYVCGSEYVLYRGINPYFYLKSKLRISHFSVSDRASF